jgi:hypothetical protein
MIKFLSGTYEFLSRFFFNYLWLGISLLLVSIIIDLSFATKTSFISIIYKLIEGIGISVLIASIFSYASSTYDFVEKIRGLLEDIIIKRNFLGNIDPQGKKEALKSLIQPSNSEINKYPNIGNYYGYFINKTLEIAQKSVRSNYQVYGHAYIDKATNLIAVDATYSYRLYPCSEGFNEITIGYSKDGGEYNSCEHVTVSTPIGERNFFNKEEIDFVESNSGGDISLIAKIPIAEIGKNHDCLDVESRIIEFGSVTSLLYSFKALQPTDGFKLHLRCDESLYIKSTAIFVVGANYYVDTSSDKKTLTITCNQWINEGSGISILVAQPDATSSISDTKSLPTPINDENEQPIAIDDSEQNAKVAG